MSNKVGGMFLDSLSNLMAAVAAVAAVWLLLRDMGVGMNMSMQGFANDGSSGASMRYDGVRSDGYADASSVVTVSSIPARQGFLGNQEQPVFWNAGNMADIARAQAQGIQKERLVDGNSDGFAVKMDYAGRPVYSGFAANPMPVYEGFDADVPQGGQFSTINRDGAVKVLTGY